MRDTKVAYHHGDLRNALVDTATDLVRSGGVESFSLRDAAKHLGVSANATYRHFSCKAALLTAVAVAGRDTLARKMRHDVDDAERGNARRPAAVVAIDRFKAAGRAYVSFGLEQPELYRLMYGPGGICRDASGEPADAYRILTEVLDPLVSTGVVDASRRVGGELRVWTMLHGFTSLVIEGAKPYDATTSLAHAIDEILEFAIRGLGASAVPAKAKAAASLKRRA